MCTLSWQQHAGSLEILFSRDELRSRPEAYPPRIDSVDGSKVLAPLDRQGGGTWLASNEHGLTVCLLNDYRHQAGSGNRAWRSRGLLVRELAALEDIGRVREQLQETALINYQPFILVVFSGMQSTTQWLWNGQILDEVKKPESPVTTSSLFPEFIPRLRRRLFRRATQNGSNPLTIEKQMALHRSRRPWPPAFAVAMSRRDRGTLSLTHVHVTPATIDMHYWHGDPAREGKHVRHSLSRLQLTPPSRPRSLQESVPGTSGIS